MRSFLISLATLAVSLFICVGLLEVGVRLLIPQPLRGVWLEPGPLGLEFNVSEGNVRHKVADTDVTYRFAAPHLRGEAGDPAARRVLVLGASFTFGWLLDEADTYVKRIERAANAEQGTGRFQFLNAAVAGASASTGLSYLQEFGDDVAPAAILYVVDGLDFGRAHNLGVHRLEADGTLSTHPAPPRPASLRLTRTPVFLWLAEHSHLFQLTKNVALAYLGQAKGVVVGDGTDRPVDDIRMLFTRTPEQDSLHRPLALALLEAMDQWAKQRHIRFIVMTTGWPHVAYSWMPAELERRGIPFLELEGQVAPVMVADQPRYARAGDGHPTAAGAEVIAEAASNRLRPYLEALRRAASVER